MSTSLFPQSEQPAFDFPQSLTEKYRLEQDRAFVWTSDTFAVNLFCMVAVPAKNLQVLGETKLNDSQIESEARYAVPGFTEHSRIDTAIPAFVVNCQKPFTGFPATRTAPAIMPENNVTHLAQAVPLPFIEHSSRPRLGFVFFGFLFARPAQDVSAQPRTSALPTQTLGIALFKPSPPSSFCGCHDRHSNILSAWPYRQTA